MRPSSSPGDGGPGGTTPPGSGRRTGDGIGDGLFGGILAKGEVAQAVSDEAWLGAMLETEVALAEVWASLSRIPPAHADAIREVCQPSRYDIGDLGKAAAAHGNPVLPLVVAIRAQLADDVRASVHFGATSQDILDTAAMLVAYRACAHILTSLRGAAEAAAQLALEHRDTPMMARTLLREAEPITFGVTAAGWLVAVSEAGQRLIQVRETRLAVQLGGPVGVLTGYSAKMLGERLGLQAPQWAWHTNRSRISDLAGALGGGCGVIGKVARDVTLLDVSEARPGLSSSMPHKRNPVAAISALGCAMQAPGLVATLHSAMIQELQRAAGAWHAEWKPLRDLLICTGSAASWLHECLSGLTVHESCSATPDLDACRAYVDSALEAFG